MDIASEAALAIMRVCLKHQDWKSLNAQITLLSKRRSQHRKTISSIVKEGMLHVSSAPSKEDSIEFIETLRAVSDGKMYLEVERAQLTKILADMKEKEGDVEGAANILQEVQVETFGSMDKREKVNYILEQMRLCLAKKDYIRSSIISKKIEPKNLLDEDIQDLKLKYYKLMIEFNTYQNDTGALSKCAEAVFNTPMVLHDVNVMQEALSTYILFMVLSVPSETQTETLKKLLLREEKKLRDMMVCAYIV